MGETKLEEATRLLQEANSEIKSLRIQNERMRLRLDMFDSCMLIIKAKLPNEGGTMSPDLCFQIEKFLAK